MNSLTRLIILLGVGGWLAGFTGSPKFAVMGVVLIIILFYSQMRPSALDSRREDFGMRRTPSQRSHSGHQDGVTMLGPTRFDGGDGFDPDNPLKQAIFYDFNNGPGREEYHRVPVIPPSAADPAFWGGYDTRINRQRQEFASSEEPDALPGYSERISWGTREASRQSRGPSGPLREDFGTRGMTPVAEQKTYLTPGMVRNGRNGAGEDPPGILRNGRNGAGEDPPGILHGDQGRYAESRDMRPVVSQGALINQRQTFAEPRNTNPQFTLTVDGPDDRFAAGNDFYQHSISYSDPSHTVDFVQPLNAGNGLAFNNDYRDTFDSNQYDPDPPLSWEPRYIGEARTPYQKALYPFDQDARTGQYRSRSTLGTPLNNEMYNSQLEGAGDGYRALPDLPGNEQYYYGSVNPFDGLFAIRSEASHMDMLTSNGKIIPQYRRENVDIEDYIEEIGERQHADELYFRDSMVEAAKAKFAETEVQYRMGPMRSMPGMQGGNWRSHRH